MQNPRAAYSAWKSAPFPPGSIDDRLDEMHADLALVDSWAFEWIAEKPDERLRHPPVDIVGEIEALVRRADVLASDVVDDQGNAVLQQYRAYAFLIRDAYIEYRAVLDAPA